MECTLQDLTFLCWMQVIPLEELGRPRVDVVVNCSGVFRDLFVNQMILLDRAVKMAAEQDEPLEMNFVRKHAIQQVHLFPIYFTESCTTIIQRFPRHAILVRALDSRLFSTKKRKVFDGNIAPQ